MEQNFGNWITEVLDCVRFRPDRKTIRRELEAHYEDHVRDLVRIGYDHPLARQRALRAMGAPEEVGKALNRVHKPWLGWLWLATRWGVVLCWALLMLSSPNYGRLVDDLTPVQREGDYEPEGLFCFSEGAPERDDSARIALGQGDSTVERAGYTLSVPYAAVWRCPREGDAGEEPYVEYWLTVVVAANKGNFWDSSAVKAAYELTAADNLGRVYSTEWDPAGGNFTMGRYDADLFRELYYFSICQLEPPGEWLEISYPYGEPWSIRVDWKEAAP